MTIESIELCIMSNWYDTKIKFILIALLPTAYIRIDFRDTK